MPFWKRKAREAPAPGSVRIRRTVIAPTSPALSTVQTLSSNNFEPLGQSFPYVFGGQEPGTVGDEMTIEAVRTNIAFARREVRRWKRSVAIMCDAVSDKEEVATFDTLLDCLLIKLTPHTMARIDTMVHEMLVPLRSWSGVVIRDVSESGDLVRNVGLSLINLSEGIKTMGVAELDEAQRTEVNSMMDSIGKFVQQHEQYRALQAKMREKEESERPAAPSGGTETAAPGVERSGSVQQVRGQKKGVMSRLRRK